MEVSVMSRQAGTAMPELAPTTARSQLGRLAVLRRRVRVAFPGAGRAGLDPARRSRRAPAMRAVVRADMAGAVEKKKAARGRKPAVRNPQLFVGLPVDAVSEGNTPNHSKAIAAGLKALKLLGADGVELPVWWGVAEKEAMGKYDWSSYLALVEMIRDSGLQIRASLCFHASKSPAIPLPTWVTSIGDADPDIYFADKEGRRNSECLSLAVDDLPVLGGKTPLEVYGQFFQSFEEAFSDFMGSTITNIAVGLGPNGELRYPSLPATRNTKAAGVGEFQCFDKHMLSHLKQQANESGNHYWGLSGPHDAPRYDQSPDSGNFFKDNGGSWETPYGDFFLSWYSKQLLSHGDRLLSTASSVFGKYPVTLSGKIPLMHSWYKTRSHPSEATAGYYNTDRRDGYDAVAEMFAKNSCKMIVTGMDLADASQPAASRSSPESLVSQIVGACKKHGVRVSGENSTISASGFGKIKENISGDKSQQSDPLMDSFTYQRMGASFFSPDHWPRFTEFIRGIDQPGLHADDLLSDDGENMSFSVDSVKGSSSNTRQMQTV